MKFPQTVWIFVCESREREIMLPHFFEQDFRFISDVYAVDALVENDDYRVIICVKTRFSSFLPDE